MTIDRRALLGVLGAGLFGACTQSIAQEGWRPSKPVRLIIPFPPGGGADVLARLTVEGVGARLGQPVVVENKGGANGSIASDYVFRAPPDGYVLLLATSDTQAMYPQIAKVNFDSRKYVPLAGIAEAGYVLMGRGDLPASTLPELLTLLKTKSLTYSSPGNGTTMHLLATLFGRQAKGELVHVPFQGAGPATQALVAGTVDLCWVPVQSAIQFRNRLRTFGLASRERLDVLKDVPTMVEQGLEIVGASWLAYIAPPGTPELIAHSLSKAVRETVASPAVLSRLREMGMSPLLQTQQEFSRYYLDEYKKWGDVIRAAGIKAD